MALDLLLYQHQAVLVVGEEMIYVVHHVADQQSLECMIRVAEEVFHTHGHQ